MLGGEMRQSLADGVVSGTLHTTRGAVSFRAWTSATRPVSVLELNATAGEGAATVALVAELAVARVNPLLDRDRMRNPAPSCSAAS